MEDVTQQNDVDDLQRAAGRRDLSGLTQALSAGPSIEPMRAALASKRHGLFLIDGDVRAGIGGALKIGGVLLSDAALRPDKDLRLLQPLAGGIAPADAAAAAPEHGALARAVFDHETHGRVAVTGIVTAGVADDLLVIGGWVVMRDGVPVPRLAGLAVLSPAGAHGFAEPSLRESLSGSAIEA